MSKKDKKNVSLYVIPEGSMSFESGRPATSEEIEEVRKLLKRGEKLQSGFWVPDSKSKYTIDHMRPATNREIMRK